MPVLKHYKAIRVIEKRIEQINGEIAISKRVLDEPEMDADVYFANHDIHNFNKDLAELRSAIECLLKCN